MYDAVMRATKTTLFENGVGIGYEVTISEEEQLDDLEIDDPGIFHRRGQRLRFACFRAGLSWHSAFPSSWRDIAKLAQKHARLIGITSVVVSPDVAGALARAPPSGN